MPAPATRAHDSRPALGHVNLMVDTFIANANVDDLRSIVRNLLATGTPDLASAFTTSARARLRQTNTKSPPNVHSLFSRETANSPSAPTTELHQTLKRARSLYGAGMGFASLVVLTSIIRATVGIRWEEDGDMADILAVIDSDIGQAIQSSKEEVDGGRVNDLASARGAVNDLRSTLNESFADVKSWNGEFPFERASYSVKYWKI